MARTDRLMRLMDALRRTAGPVTAQALATETGVSLRQLYRDIATLRAGGALIDGEAGLGYTLTEDTALPPQSFSQLEIEALVLALSGLDQLADPALTRAGQDAMARIIATLPDKQARQAMNTALRSFRRPNERPPVMIDMDALRQAIWDEQSVSFRYTDLKGRITTREVWPLAMSYGDRESDAARALSQTVGFPYVPHLADRGSGAGRSELSPETGRFGPRVCANTAHTGPAMITSLCKQPASARAIAGRGVSSAGWALFGALFWSALDALCHVYQRCRAHLFRRSDGAGCAAVPLHASDFLAWRIADGLCR